MVYLVNNWKTINEAKLDYRLRGNYFKPYTGESAEV